ncbi:hypothetical protein NBRC116494_33400 [Aurantivibrio plasticivorans]
MKRLKPLSAVSGVICALFLSTSVTAETKEQALNENLPHYIGAAKLIVQDLPKTQTFYEDLFGMEEVKRYNYAPEVFEETIMSFGEGARLALFAPNPKAEAPVRDSQYPVVLFYTPDFATITAKVKELGYPIRVLANFPTMQVAITRDPSGNAVEIFGRKESKMSVGGSKLIVRDRKEAEAFYTEVFGATVLQYLDSPDYDEVLLTIGKGPFLALFQPLKEEPLAKSKFPQTAFYTTEFDAVVAKIEALGFGYRKVATQTEGLNIIIARDPSGNAIEIIEEK